MRRIPYEQFVNKVVNVTLYISCHKEMLSLINCKFLITVFPELAQCKVQLRLGLNRKNVIHLGAVRI